MNNKCKICDSDRIVNYFGSDERIKKCRKCGVGFLNSDTFVRKPDYYEEGANYSAVLEDKQRLEYISRNAREQLSLMTENFKSKGKTLLDVGAHTGQFVREAFQLGFIAEGIEPNRVVADWARNKGISIQQSELENFNSPKKYDVITMFHVLEHFKDPMAALSKTKDLLGNRGYFIAEVPNSASYLARLDGVAWKFIALEHLFYFTENSLKNVLRDSGFSIIYSKKRNYELNYLNPSKLLRYLTGKKIFRDRFGGKNAVHNKILPVPEKRFINSAFQKVMVCLIGMLGREDHIFIIARKND